MRRRVATALGHVSIETGSDAGRVELTCEDSAPLNDGSPNATTLVLTRREAEDVACKLLNACGWDTAALLAEHGGRAPVFVGELEMRSVRAVRE